ncbi:hypothetical protein SASPL_141320 [Salvia splendens]|uniref:Uncharacterized protein n=1 Tax=Salvia splendens TaxID=180675 RepID=A0A8X8WRX7_SALSN|nr:hypothetical protein SASPL_141320 [Salvia splendens]
MSSIRRRGQASAESSEAEISGQGFLEVKILQICENPFSRFVFYPSLFAIFVFISVGFFVVILTWRCGVVFCSYVDMSKCQSKGRAVDEGDGSGKWSRSAGRQSKSEVSAPIEAMNIESKGETVHIEDETEIEDLIKKNPTYSSLVLSLWYTYYST